MICSQNSCKMVLSVGGSNSTCLTPKMVHLATPCDVIGHDVRVKPDIPNERARAKLYCSEVSWSKMY